MPTVRINPLDLEPHALSSQLPAQLSKARPPEFVAHCEHGVRPIEQDNTPQSAAMIRANAAEPCSEQSSRRLQSAIKLCAVIELEIV